ncbi:Epoxide hydrolase-like [Parasponia andersonii]|uniref:Epoxide hydrolase-like n=1 Tax=Parasponia andersonii TaxID=3476 RepID=A0A2P5C9V1_PARAD|nr:Epoxide hydrolase-like [Parasponia andersonii]
MVNFLTVLDPVLRALLNFYGLRSQSIEIEPGTVVHFWGPSQISENYTSQNNQAKSANHLEKPALVLLHGFAATGVLTWLLQIMAFSGTYAVFVPDLIFFGDSTTHSANRSPEYQAECLAKGLKRLGVERCTVVGCSYGGIIGSKMAVLEPELVRCLVLSNSNVAITELQSEEAFERIGSRSWPELMLPETVEGLRKLLGAVIFKRPWLPDWAYKHFLEVMFDSRQERAELLKALVIKDKDFAVPKFSQKICVMAGEEDKIFTPEIVQKTKAQLGDKATIHVIKKAGHLVHLERPFVYNRLLKKSLTNL